MGGHLGANFIAVCWDKRAQARPIRSGADPLVPIIAPMMRGCSFFWIGGFGASVF